MNYEQTPIWPSTSRSQKWYDNSCSPKGLKRIKYTINRKVIVNLGTNNKPLDTEPLLKETCLSGLERQDGASASQQSVTEQVGEILESTN